MNPGLLGGIIGGTIGIIGGLIGTYYSIKNTHSQSERAFMIRAAVGIWNGVIVFLVMLMTLPWPYKMLLWVPYLIALPIAINAINKRQVAFRRDHQS